MKNKVTIFKNILDDPLVKQVLQLNSSIKNDGYLARDLYYDLLSHLLDYANRNYFHGHLWQGYLLSLLVKEENIFSLMAEKFGKNLDGQVTRIATLDMAFILELYNIDWQELRKELDISEDYRLEDFPNYYPDMAKGFYLDNLEKLKEHFATDDPSFIVDGLASYYQQNGSGNFNKYIAFRWEKEKGLVGIRNSDPITFEDLVGYDYQKNILINNTEAFIKGSQANNVLLFGDKGTGKSSSVKALLNRYHPQGLRLIELSKGNIFEFPKLLEKIKDRDLKFIVFLDDLSFEDFEVEYKHIKAIIEGGLEVKPKNVLIYATSNRRHLIKESWNDQDNSGEIRISDSVQEKLSLVDRFGITITFGTPDQDEYLNIVHQLAKKHNLELSPEELSRRALQWELWYHGRSGRTAQQFINYLLGEAGK